MKISRFLSLIILCISATLLLSDDTSAHSRTDPLSGRETLHAHCTGDPAEGRLGSECPVNPPTDQGGDTTPQDPPGDTTGTGGTAFIPPPVAVDFQNPLAFNTVEGVLGRVLSTIQSIIAILAVLFIVIGGIIYITSAGNSQRTELAKNAIWAAVIGLALAVAAPSFLQELYRALGASAPVEDGGIGAALSLSQIALNVLKFLLSITGILSVIALVVGGIIYITSAGSSERIEMGKKTVLYAIIGLVIALVSLVVVTQIVRVL